MAGDRHDGAFVFGAVLGAVASAAATLLVTPRSGDSLRAELLGRGRELRGRALELVEQGRAQLGLGAEPELPAPVVPSAAPASAAEVPVEPPSAEDTAVLPPVPPAGAPEGVPVATVRPEHAGDVE
ncbi:MAG TPA: YtxH domain-containing protein [Thermomicrobiaceae bacterium]|nr:YtxH domain-containing protein [Thermomicrobiaceae bacterium]